MKVKTLGLKILLGFFVLLLIAAIVYRDMLAYGYMQLQGQLQVVREAVLLEEFLENDSTTQEQKEKIQVILDAKEFAFNELGINYSENYSTILDQKGKPSMYVVTACQPLLLYQEYGLFRCLANFLIKVISIGKSN